MLFLLWLIFTVVYVMASYYAISLLRKYGEIDTQAIVVIILYVLFSGSLLLLGLWIIS